MSIRRFAARGQTGRGRGLAATIHNRLNATASPRPRARRIANLLRQLARRWWPEHAAAPPQPPLCFHGFEALETRIMLSAAESAASAVLEPFSAPSALFVDSDQQAASAMTIAAADPEGASIAGTAWDDADHDGIRDAGEAGLPDVVVYLDENDNGVRDWEDANANNAWDAGEGEQWVTTGAGGDYLLTGLDADDYRVRQIAPPGYAASPMFSGDEIQWIADDRVDSDDFGFSVAIDDGIALIGAVKGGTASFPNSGSAYLFDIATGSQLDELVDPAADGNDQFGFSVAIGDGIAAIGAPSKEDHGAVFVFDVQNRTLLHTITADDPESGDWFGYSVAIEDGQLLVGAPRDDDHGTNSGSAYLFDLTTGDQLEKYTASDAAAIAWFGESVALDGGIALIGAYNADGMDTLTGAAYLIDITTGEQRAKLIADDGGSGDEFGGSVAIKDGMAIVGARLSGPDGAKGTAYLFDVATGAQLHRLAAVGADQFGNAVALYDGLAVVTAVSSNAVYLFDALTGDMVDSLAGSDSSSFDYFGSSVAAAEGTLLVGARYHKSSFPDPGPGTVFRFSLAPGQAITLVTDEARAGIDFANHNPVPTAADRSATVADDIAPGEPVGSILAFDQYDDVLSYAITAGDDAGLFAIDSATGVVSVAPGQALDFSMAQSHDLTVTVTDSIGQSASAQLAVTVTQVPRDGSIAGTAWDDADGDGVQDGGEAGLPGVIVYLDANDNGLRDWEDNPVTGTIGAWDPGEGEQWVVSDASGGYILTGLGDGDYIVRQIAPPGYTANPDALGAAAKWTADDPVANDEFGDDVAIGDGVVIVGALGDDSGASEAGSAYVLDLATGDVKLELIAPDAAFDDGFGHSVATSGNYAVIGAPRDGTNVGAAYLFDLTDGALVTKLVHTGDNTVDDQFGYSVAMDDGVILVGAPRRDTPGGQGVVYRFEEVAGQWTQVGLLAPDDPDSASQFGHSVDLDDGVAIVGAHLGDGGVNQSGTAHLFDLATGEELRVLAASDGATNDRFGYSVAIDGGLAIVGARSHENFDGAAYIFDVGTGMQLHDLVAPGSAEFFGGSVSLDQGLALVGSSGTNAPGILDAGAAYLYDADSGALVHTIMAPDPVYMDQLGRAVAMRNGIVIAGARNDDHPSVAGSNQGAVYRFVIHAAQFVTVSGGEAVTDVDFLLHNPVPTAADDAFAVHESTAPGMPVRTVMGFDLYGDILTYAITAGNTDNVFTIDPQTGVISLDDGKNLNSALTPSFTLTVTVTDSIGGSDTATLNVTVTGENDLPVITSPDTFTVDEGETTAGTVSATDPELASLTFDIVGGADEALFSIDASTGELTFLAPPDFENPGDADGDNDYEITIEVTDDETAAATQALTITVTDVDDESPVITSETFSVEENQTAVGTVVATDPDSVALTYSISGGADADLFTINENTGALAFQRAPDFENPGDADGDNDYEITIEVTDDETAAATQALTITVTDVDDESPVITSETFSVEENQTVVGTVIATDPDSAALTYSISGGADAGLFTINEDNGALTFQSAPDFESPGDANGDNDYEITIEVTDDETAAATQALTITVTDVDDESPVITSETFSVEENQTIVGTVDASDPDSAALTYSISGGADAGLFQVDPDSGALAFRIESIPNFENPGDADADNNYEVTVSVSDGTNPVATQVLTVAVTDQDESPIIDSDSFTLPENTTAAGTVAARDPESAALAFSIIGGVDAALLTIDETSGNLAFLAAPDFEAPGDADADNVYRIVVQVTDGTQAPVTQAVAVSVTDLNEQPTVDTDSFTIPENTTSVGVVAASDSDSASLSFSIIGGADAALLTIDETTGALAFLAAPDFEAPADADPDNVYHITVDVHDGVSLPVSRAVTITVTNVDEPPTIPPQSFILPENTASVGTIAAVDPDSASLALSISGQDAALFAIDEETGALTFLAAPDFEAPGDIGANNVYDLTVQVTDGASTAARNISVTVTDADEPPAISSASTFSIPENTNAVTTIEATDPDAGDLLTYSLIGGADLDHFTIDDSGMLRFDAAPDFESPGDADLDNIYRVVIQVSDGTHSVNRMLDIVVLAAAEGPVFLSGDAFDVAENEAAVATIIAADPDAGDVLAFDLGDAADSHLFTIDAVSGALSFAVAPDFEMPADASGDNTYLVEVHVSDGTFTAVQNLEITVTNADEAPWFTSPAAFDVAENTTPAAAIGAIDQDAGSTLIYSLSGGADMALFAIDPLSGALTFKAAPDYEQPGDADGDNTYHLQLTVSDEAHAVMQDVLVTVKNLDETPAFISAAAVDVYEALGTFVTTLAAWDQDAGTDLSYSLVGGADVVHFTLDETTGALNFTSPRDFEQPLDDDRDNRYLLQVQVTDGYHVVTQDMVVSVVDLREIVFRDGLPATYTDAQGNEVLLAMRGLGEGTAFFTLGTGPAAAPGDPLSLMVDGTGLHSVVYVAVVGHRSLTHLTDVRISGDLGVLSALDASLSGSLDIDGHVRGVALADVHQGTITLGGDASQYNILIFRSLRETQIISASGIGRMLVLNGWHDHDDTDDLLAAPWAWRIVVGHAMQASLQLTGEAAPHGFALGRLRTDRIEGAQYTLASGNAGIIEAGGIEGLTVDAASGSITRLLSRTRVVGLDLESGHMGSLGVAGGAWNVNLRLTGVGGTGIEKLAVTGHLVNSTVVSAGDVMRFHAGGMVDSRMLVGITAEGEASPDRLPQAMSTTFTDAQPMLVHATVRGGDDVGLIRSQIAAARIMRLAIVGEIAGDPGSSVSGAAADRIDRYYDYNPLSQVIRRGVRLMTQDDADSQVGPLGQGVALRIA